MQFCFCFFHPPAGPCAPRPGMRDTRPTTSSSSEYTLRTLTRFKLRLGYQVSIPKLCFKSRFGFWCLRFKVRSYEKVFLLFLLCSPDSIASCWYILLSGSVFVKEHMYLARCWYVDINARAHTHTSNFANCNLLPKK